MIGRHGPHMREEHCAGAVARRGRGAFAHSAWRVAVHRGTPGRACVSLGLARCSWCRG